MAKRSLEPFAGWAAIALFVSAIVATELGAFMVAGILLIATTVPFFWFLYLHYAPERERMRARRAAWRRDRDLGLTTLTEQQACDPHHVIPSL